MALLRYFKPVNGRPVHDKEIPYIDPNEPVSKHVPPTVISGTELQNIEKVVNRRAPYLKINEEDKAKVASIHGVARTVRHFKDLNLKETSVRDWKKLYEKELKRLCHEKPGDQHAVAVLPSKKRGRPLLIGEKADEYVRKLVGEMRE